MDSSLARHAVACFLTRGDLWISREDGQRVFEELLLDADWALNAGNWMWLSASAFYHLYYRVYSPVSFGKKTDKDGEYIRKYVPELANYPKSMIYEPWTATAAQQREFGCIIGKDYPQRIVIHDVVLKKNMAKMADTYQKHRDGGGGGKFDVDNTQVKPEPSTSSGCSSSKIMKMEQNSTIVKYFKKDPKNP
ncbi:(6-4)DNA photolyase-like [Bradysia coprophila]|uniref:(6-4)DNA photolyase-like n=1 Tax=Bradysia coprophila TaxID=38358 RepID=UPI00187D9D7C|nr:(6-4)DNA photolyase-like [Bradysia coprophila]